MGGAAHESPAGHSVAEAQNCGVVSPVGHGPAAHALETLMLPPAKPTIPQHNWPPMQSAMLMQASMVMMPPSPAAPELDPLLPEPELEPEPEPEPPPELVPASLGVLAVDELQPAASTTPSGNT
jgi:hypothetical protein